MVSQITHVIVMRRFGTFSGFERTCNAMNFELQDSKDCDEGRPLGQKCRLLPAARGVAAGVHPTAGARRPPLGAARFVASLPSE